mgnify:CR=1 FL=1
MPNKVDKCIICGSNLKYVTQTDMTEMHSCYFCGKEDRVNIFCPKGHYVCSECHSKNAIEIIEDFCADTSLKDPFVIAEKIMKHPKFKMYGPEHHALTPAVLLTALKNNGINKPNGSPIINSDILEGIRRASKIPGGWCGFYGACGAGIGAGVAISIFTQATPSRDRERTFSIEMTSRALHRIADDIEHCCKRSVRLSIIEALKYLNEKFDVKLPFHPDCCAFSDENEKCEKQRCPLFS